MVSSNSRFVEGGVQLSRYSVQMSGAVLAQVGSPREHCAKLRRPAAVVGSGRAPAASALCSAARRHLRDRINPNRKCLADQVVVLTILASPRSAITAERRLERPLAECSRDAGVTFRRSLTDNEGRHDLTLRVDPGDEPLRLLALGGRCPAYHADLGESQDWSRRITREGGVACRLDFRKVLRGLNAPRCERRDQDRTEQPPHRHASRPNTGLSCEGHGSAPTRTSSARIRSTALSPMLPISAYLTSTVVDSIAQNGTALRPMRSGEYFHFRIAEDAGCSNAGHPSVPLGRTSQVATTSPAGDTRAS
jgi:hypothetical protein